MNDLSHQFCTFHVDTLYFGIEVKRVQEVIRFQRMTRVPLAPSSISGLINLRGQIVTAIDLRRRLGLPPRGLAEQPMNVVVRDGESGVSLLVDRIGDVVEVGDELFEPPPSTIPKALRGLIRGAYKLSNRLLLVLDAESVLAPGNSDSPEEVAVN